MKQFTYFTVVVSLLGTMVLGAAEKGNPEAELRALNAKVQEKVNSGKRTEKDFAGELKQFDALLEQHKGEKTDAVAQIAYQKALVYYQYLENPVRASELIEQLRRDFPDTVQGRSAEATLAVIKRESEGREAQSSMVPGAAFPGFSETDMQGRPLNLADLKGKVVLVTFWASWSDPSMKQLPAIAAMYEKHHGKGFEVVGISVDGEKDKEKLSAAIAKHKLPWPQFYDGQAWNNKLALKYGVKVIPATYLLDGEGKIIGKDLSDAALEVAIIKNLKP